MTQPPRRKPRFPEDFDREDELQEYQLTAGRLRDASPETIQRCTKERWDKHRSKKKREAPSQLSKEQFLDRADWDCFREAVGEEDDAILAYDLERAYESACRVYPKPVVLAAMGLLTVTEAVAAVRVRTEKVPARVRFPHRLQFDGIVVIGPAENPSSNPYLPPHAGVTGTGA